MLPAGELVDDIGGEAPTRERLARCYGRAWADFAHVLFNVKEFIFVR